MVYIIVSFRSRSETLRLSSFLTDRGIFNKVISTPKEANVGCGLSVKIFESSYSAVKNIVVNSSLKSLIGFFRVKNYGERLIVSSI